jgi:hypothetical protein
MRLTAPTEVLLCTGKESGAGKTKSMSNQTQAVECMSKLGVWGRMPLSSLSLWLLYVCLLQDVPTGPQLFPSSALLTCFDRFYSSLRHGEPALCPDDLLALPGRWRDDPPIWFVLDELDKQYKAHKQQQDQLVQELLQDLRNKKQQL